MIVAVVAAVLGFLELRDALAFDKRAMSAAALRTDVLRLQVTQEAAIRRFARSHRSDELQPFRMAAPQIEPKLDALAAAIDDLGMETTPTISYVDVLRDLHRRWLVAVAVPLTTGSVSPRQLRADLLADRIFIDSYRISDREIGDEIDTVLIRHADSFEQRYLQIALLFCLSLLMCAAGVALAAGQFVQLDRARARAEATLRERELLYEQGRVWSNSFQRAVLPPRLPDSAACRFDAVYQPGASDAHIGGDWYDAVRLVDGRILISIGDVAGNGLEAAVVMGVVRQIMRGVAQVHASPALMLDAADRALRIEYADVFVTAWVGILDAVTRTLTYASAGHPPALLATPTGQVEELHHTDLPLGLRQGHQSSATTIPLIDATTLVLYTDGLTEATRDIAAGEALVREATASIATGPWQRPASEIAEHVLAKNPLDDVAILVARIDFSAVDRAIRRLTFDVRDPQAARNARAILQGILAERRFGQIESLNAELVFGELIGNVVRHAPQSAHVEVAIDCSGPQTVLHVLDRGPGFQHIGRLPSDPFSESGRGLFLIAAMTDEFSVIERPHGGSHARAVLVERVAGQAAPGPSGTVTLTAS